VPCVLTAEAFKASRRAEVLAFSDELSRWRREG